MLLFWKPHVVDSTDVSWTSNKTMFCSNKEKRNFLSALPKSFGSCQNNNLWYRSGRTTLPLGALVPIDLIFEGNNRIRRCRIGQSASRSRFRDLIPSSDTAHRHASCWTFMYSLTALPAGWIYSFWLTRNSLTRYLITDTAGELQSWFTPQCITAFRKLVYLESLKRIHVWVWNSRGLLKIYRVKRHSAFPASCSSIRIYLLDILQASNRDRHA